MAVSAEEKMTRVHGHSRSDRRNLYLHRAALEKLREDPSLLSRCVTLLDSWLAREQSARPYLEKWKEMLTRWPLPEVMRVVLDETQGQPLRQCSPLGPVLTPRERWVLLEEVNRQGEAGR